MDGISGTTALITDVERRKALPIVRALGRENVRVVGLSHHKLPLCQFSKYCDKVIRCSDYRAAPENFLDELRTVCQRERPDVLYFLEDEVLSLCVENDAYWSGMAAALVPDADCLDVAYDKWKTLQAAESIGIPIPRSFCPSDEEDLRAIIGREAISQWVVKPRKSSGSRGIKYVDDSSKLISAYRIVAETYARPIVQERLPQHGTGIGAFFLIDRNDRMLARFGHRRLREFPVSGGPSTLRESFRDERILAQSEKLVRRLGCVGVSMVEYKYDSRRSDYLLMEVNPRFWGSLALPIHAGVNFPVLYHMACLGIEVEPALDFDSGILCRWLWPGDLLHFLTNPDRFKLDPGFFRFNTQGLAYDIISKDDPWPILGMIIEAMRKMVTRGR